MWYVTKSHDTEEDKGTQSTSLLHKLLARPAIASHAAETVNSDYVYVHSLLKVYILIETILQKCLHAQQQQGSTFSE